MCNAPDIEFYFKGADQAQNVSTSSSAAPSHVTDMVDHVINSVAKLRSAKFPVHL